MSRACPLGHFLEKRGGEHAGPGLLRTRRAADRSAARSRTRQRCHGEEKVGYATVQRAENLSAKLDDQLRSAVVSPDVHWTPAEEVSIVAATRALQGWLADRRPYDGQHKQGWKSAIADFQRSVGRLGPGLRTVLGTDLAAAVSAVSQLDADITSNEDRTKALLQARRNPDQQLLNQLSARWAQPQTRVGAWSDLTEACRDPAVTWEALSLRRELFWQLVREGDHDAEQMSRYLVGVLGNQAFGVSLARLWLGDISEDEVPRPLSATGAALD